MDNNCSSSHVHDGSYWNLQCFKTRGKSYADKIISIVCAVLSVIIALFGIPYTAQNVQVIKENEVIVDKEQILLIDAEKDIRIGDYDTAKSNYELLY